MWGKTRFAQFKNGWRRFRSKRRTENLPFMGRMKELFEREQIPYRLISHSEVFTAPEVAASLHITGRKVVKVVLVWVDGRYVMAVLPSHRFLDLTRFTEILRARKAMVAKEWEVGKLFPDCEVGAIPPFGNLYGLPVYVDMALAMEDMIYFPAGSHHVVVEMRYKDFERIVHPEVDRFGHRLIERASGF